MAGGGKGANLTGGTGGFGFAGAVPFLPGPGGDLLHDGTGGGEGQPGLPSRSFS